MSECDRCRYVLPSGECVFEWIERHPAGAPLRAVAEEFGLTHQRIQQIEAIALERIRMRLPTLSPQGQRHEGDDGSKVVRKAKAIVGASTGQQGACVPFRCPGTDSRTVCDKGVYGSVGGSGKVDSQARSSQIPFGRNETGTKTNERDPSRDTREGA